MPVPLDIPLDVQYLNLLETRSTFTVQIQLTRDPLSADRRRHVRPDGNVEKGIDGLWAIRSRLDAGQSESAQTLEFCDASGVAHVTPPSNLIGSGIERRLIPRQEL